MQAFIHKKLLLISALSLALVGCFDTKTNPQLKRVDYFSLCRDREKATFVTSPTLDIEQVNKSYIRKFFSFKAQEMTKTLKYSQSCKPPMTEFKVTGEKTKGGDEVVGIKRVSEANLSRNFAWHLKTLQLRRGGPIKISCQVREASTDNSGDKDSLIELLAWEKPTKAFSDNLVLPLSTSDEIVYDDNSNWVTSKRVLVKQQWQSLSLAFMLREARNKLALRFALSSRLKGTLQIRNLKVEHPKPLRHFAQNWRERNGTVEGIEGLFRHLHHKGEDRQFLLLPARTKVHYPIVLSKFDLLDLEYAWSITGYTDEVKASLLYKEGDQTTEIWSALSTAQRPESAGKPPVNESWRREKLELDKIKGEKGKLLLSVELTDKKKRYSSQEFVGNAVFLLGEALFHSKDTLPYEERAPNIVLFSVDSLSPDALPGGTREAYYATPHFDELFSHAARSKECIAASGMTFLALPSLLTSRYPQRNGVKFYGAQLNKTTQSIGRTLAAEYYNVVHFTHTYILDYVWKPCNAGFPVCRIRPNEIETENDFISFLAEEHDRPFFAYIHKDTRYSSIDVGEWDGKEHIWQRKYRQLIMNADALLGQIMTTIKKQRLKRPTMLVITADHGEDIVGAPLQWSHCTLYDSSLRIPFIIDYPGFVAPGLCFSRQSRSIDIAPTILGLLKIKAPASFEGHDLSALFGGNKMDTPPPPALSIFATFNDNYIYSVREPPWKYIYNPANKPTLWYPISNFVYKKNELYNIKTDPFERKNLANKYPTKCEELRRELTLEN